MREKTLSFGEIMYLKDKNVEKIIIRYSGGGDSGQIDETFYTSEKLRGEFCAEYLSIPKDIDSKIESIGYRLLEGIGDWYNNEGGQGTISINVSDLSYGINAEYNPEQTGTYDEETEEWIPDEDQEDPYEEYYEGVLEKD